MSSFLEASDASSAPVDLSESFTYQGRFLSSDGSTALTEVLSLQLSIYDPSAACLLYQESQSVDTSQTNGLFAIDVGSVLGDAKRSATFNSSVSLDPGLTMAKVFANTGQVLPAGSANCSAGYTPAAGDGRLLRVTVLPAVGSLTTLSPDLGINSVPMAKVAEVAQTLQGYVPGTAANNLVQLDGNAKLPAVDGSQLTNLNVSGSLGFTPAPASGSANYAPASGSANYAPASGSANYAPASGSANYLSPTTAASTYLTQANASSTYEPISGMSSYLTTASAASTYLTQANAASTYEPISGMSSYLTTANAASTYLTQANAASTYVPIQAPIYWSAMGCTNTCNAVALGSSNYAFYFGSTPNCSSMGGNPSSYITYNNSGAAGPGDSWKINKNGIYSIVITVEQSGTGLGAIAGFSSPIASGTPVFNGTYFKNILAIANPSSPDTYGSATYTGYIAAGTYIQLFEYGTCFNYTNLTITLVSPTS